MPPTQVAWAENCAAGETAPVYVKKNPYLKEKSKKGRRKEEQGDFVIEFHLYTGTAS